jgi:hypothetical protein
MASDENQRYAAMIEHKSRTTGHNVYPDVFLCAQKAEALIRAAMTFGVRARQCMPVFIWSFTDKVGYVNVYDVVRGMSSTRTKMNGELVDVYKVPTVAGTHVQLKYLDEVTV